jgi:DNA-binding response OmpR family regulator/predicted regulator of Ras-like GTPase activity (Roadblock/LC7/MglB family)
MTVAEEDKDRILLVGQDDELRSMVSEVLEGTGRYLTVEAGTFEDALSEVLLGSFALVVTETELPDLSGMDLLAVVSGLRPGTPVMLIDDDLSAKSAVASIRLGACDYLYKPLNLEFLVMQIERQIDLYHATIAMPPPEEVKPKPKPTRDRERRLNRATRGAALVLGRDHFKAVNQELARLLGHIRAHFVGLIDVDGNLVGAAGTLDKYDLVLLTQALSIDPQATSTLASILHEEKFHSTYLEGDESGVYIIEIREPYLLSLAVICPTDVKAGMVWLYSKRTAENIARVLQASTKQKPVPRLTTE